jgi:hypothetical protein
MKNGKATEKHGTRWPFIIAHLYPYTTATGILYIHIAYQIQNSTDGRRIWMV